MNKFNGHITEIIGEGSILLVKVKVKEQTLTTLTIGASSNPLKVNQEIDLMVKETEVFIGKNILKDSISIQNQLEGIIVKIEKGEVLSRVILATEIGNISSVITQQSIHRLSLEEGSSAVAFIKTNEIILD